MIEGSFDIVGAAGPASFFGNLTRATLSHGYLFTGPAGVGKKTFALRLAQSLLCVTPKSALLGYCGACTGCTRVAAGAHPDMYVAAGQLKIGDRDGSGFHETEETTARDVVRQLSMHSYAGGKRVFILGDADFTREAANALLKFFEEPPADVVLIVTTAQPGRILATIRSRLIDVTFPRLSVAEIVTVLERGGVESDEAVRAAEIGNGSITRAKAYLDEEEGAARDSAIEWFYAAVNGEETDASGWATRPNLEEGLETIKTLTRDWLVIAISGEGAPLLARDQTSALKKLPARDPAVLAKSLAAIGEAERIARTNVTPVLVADLVRMALAPGR
ncbi:MAG: DNA polymerase III subunit delta' [Candidatus Velthaea sp.]